MVAGFLQQTQIENARALAFTTITSTFPSTTCAERAPTYTDAPPNRQSGAGSSYDRVYALEDIAEIISLRQVHVLRKLTVKAQAATNYQVEWAFPSMSYGEGAETTVLGAYDANGDLKWEVIQDKDTRYIRIIFRNPVKPGETYSFSWEWDLKWSLDNYYWRSYLGTTRIFYDLKATAIVPAGLELVVREPENALTKKIGDGVSYAEMHLTDVTSGTLWVVFSPLEGRAPDWVRTGSYVKLDYVYAKGGTTVSNGWLRFEVSSITSEFASISRTWSNVHNQKPTSGGFEYKIHLATRLATALPEDILDVKTFLWIPQSIQTGHSVFISTQYYRVVGTEPVTTSLGTFDCWKLVYSGKDRTSTLWYMRTNRLLVKWEEYNSASSETDTFSIGETNIVERTQATTTMTYTRTVWTTSTSLPTETYTETKTSARTSTSTTVTEQPTLKWIDMERFAAIMIREGKSWWCGQLTVANMINYHVGRVVVTPENVVSSTRDWPGLLPWEIESAVNHFAQDYVPDRHAKLIWNFDIHAVVKEIDNNRPVVLLRQKGLVGHATVIVGYEITLSEGVFQSAFLPLSQMSSAMRVRLLVVPC